MNEMNVRLWKWMLLHSFYDLGRCSNVRDSSCPSFIAHQLLMCMVRVLLVISYQLSYFYIQKMCLKQELGKKRKNMRRKSAVFILYDVSRNIISPRAMRREGIPKEKYCCSPIIFSSSFSVMVGGGVWMRPEGYLPTHHHSIIYKTAFLSASNK